MVETNRVASAIPYDGLKAVLGNPNGAKAVSNAVMAAMLTGSEPMISTTLPRSMSPAPTVGTPRCAVHS